ncbi:helix-turn-helix domain-containing protein [Ideonella sp. A 288]|uniref:helix-turn-helix domain-containing protein n=1 Tax=Ideonella sp. A 288 TaxID=1962181 RepID=UPI000B4BC5D6|nr:helix-turn-helix domain-containing protein [Ideonella sp. A 288]
MPDAVRTADIPIAQVGPPRSGTRCLRAQVLDTACTGCQLSTLCPPCGLASQPLAARQRVEFARVHVPAGRHLYRRGDRFQCLYAVRAGALKSTMTRAHGRDQICGFHLPGEVFALDGVASGTHATTITALEDSQVCAVAYGPLIDTISGDPALEGGLSRLMSHEISRGHRQMLLLGTLNAHQRLAVFLMDQSQRSGAQGHSVHDFNLRMTRADIGSFLGLTLETVCRTFASLQARGLLQVDQRRIRIVDLPALSRSCQAL